MEILLEVLDKARLEFEMAEKNFDSKPNAKTAKTLKEKRSALKIAEHEYNKENRPAHIVKSPTEISLGLKSVHILIKGSDIPSLDRIVQRLNSIITCCVYGGAPLLLFHPRNFV